LVLVHVLGVAVESWKARDNLAAAMITGRKSVGPGESGADARAGRPFAFALALSAGAAIFVALALASA
jgi:hypothetical protein